MTDDHEQVRERAYQLWEQAGRPQDRSLEFWYAAIRELQQEAAAAGAPVVEPGVLEAAPETLAFRPAEKPAAEAPEPRPARKRSR